MLVITIRLHFVVDNGGTGSIIVHPLGELVDGGNLMASLEVGVSLLIKHLEVLELGMPELASGLDETAIDSTIRINHRRESDLGARRNMKRSFEADAIATGNLDGGLDSGGEGLEVVGSAHGGVCLGD